MCAGADSIDDLDVLRAGGMPILFDGVYAPSTLGVLLREFSFGHARQLESVLREHLVALAERTELLAGIEEQAFIDIDSLLRPVYGHAKQGASYGHTKIAGKQVLRKGLSPLATTISTAHCAPVIAGMRLRAGKPARARARADGRPGDRHRAGGRRDGEDPGPRRLGLRQPRGGARLRARQGRVLPGHDQEPGHPAGHRRHPGHGLDPGALPGRGPRPRHRRVDLRRRGRRGHLHRLRRHQGPDHRPAGGAPGQRRPLPRRAVPGLALPPVLHQHRPCPPRRPTSSTAATRSSRPCSPT